MPRRKINIYEYEDFRRFLADFLELLRRSRKGFSLRGFAAEAGFGSHSFLPAVIKGSKNLTVGSVEKIASALHLNRSETEYFEVLVAFGQADSLPDKDSLFKKMNHLRRNTAPYKLRKAQ